MIGRDQNERRVLSGMARWSGAEADMIENDDDDEAVLARLLRRRLVSVTRAVAWTDYDMWHITELGRLALRVCDVVDVGALVGG